jgi:hypothetical protein
VYLILNDAIQGSPEYGAPTCPIKIGNAEYNINLTKYNSKNKAWEDININQGTDLTIQAGTMMIVSICGTSTGSFQYARWLNPTV